MAYSTILTDTGQQILANAEATNTKVDFAYIAVGDGNGVEPTPDPTQTTLVNEVWRGNVNNIYIDPDNPSWIVIEGIIPASDGGFWIREIGVFDSNNNLVLVGNYPSTYKPTLADGSSSDMYLRVILQTANTSVVNLTLDPSVVLADKQYVDNSIITHNTDPNAHPDILNQVQTEIGKVSPIKKPTITSPTNGTTGFWNTITSSAFTTSSTFEGKHEASDWEIATDANFTNIIESSYNDTVNLTSYLPTQLSANTTYYVRVRHKSDNHISDWSDPISFTTGANRPPEIISVNWSSDVLYDNSSYTVEIIALDPDNDALTYSITASDPNITITQDTTNPALFTITFPDYAADTTITFTYSVSDGTVTITQTENKVIKIPVNVYISNSSFVNIAENLLMTQNFDLANERAEYVNSFNIEPFYKGANFAFLDKERKLFFSSDTAGGIVVYIFDNYKLTPYLSLSIPNQTIIHMDKVNNELYLVIGVDATDNKNYINFISSDFTTLWEKVCPVDSRKSYTINSTYLIASEIIGGRVGVHFIDLASKSKVATHTSSSIAVTTDYLLAGIYSYKSIPAIEIFITTSTSSFSLFYEFPSWESVDTPTKALYGTSLRPFGVEAFNNIIVVGVNAISTMDLYFISETDRITSIQQNITNLSTKYTINKLSDNMKKINDRQLVIETITNEHLILDTNNIPIITTPVSITVTYNASVSFPYLTDSYTSDNTINAAQIKPLTKVALSNILHENTRITGFNFNPIYI